MIVQLLYFPGCPNVDAARASLRAILGEAKEPVEVVEIDVTAEATPEEFRCWGSPTILVDGKDVAGGAPSGTSCRLYPGSANPGVPPLARIRAVVSAGTTPEAITGPTRN